MLHLGKDILKLIFRKLTIEDQIVVCKVCPYTKDIVEKLVWPSQYTKLVTSCKNAKSLELEEFEIFFGIMQNRIETLVIGETTHIAFRSFRSEMAFYLSFDFPALRRLEWDDERLEMEDMHVVIDRWPSLEFLRLSTKITYGTHIKDSRNCWDALRICGTFNKLKLYNMSRFDHLLDFIERTPRLVSIYLSNLLGFRREIILKLVVPLIRLLETQPERSGFTITSAYIPAELLKLEAYVAQDVLRCVTENRKEDRSKPPYVEFKLTPKESATDEDTEETDLEDLTEQTESSELSESNVVKDA